MLFIFTANFTKAECDVTIRTIKKLFMETNIIIAGFWPRLAALLIDVIFVCIVGFGLGAPLQDQLAKLGKYGVLIGLIFVVAYLTVFNSKVLNGQTLGKSGLDIQVVDKHGNLLGINKSFYRALILAAPYFILRMSDVFGVTFLSLLTNVFLQSFLVGLILIYIFNKGNRQSLHDLLVGSYVVTINRKGEPGPLPSLTKVSLYISGALVVVLTAFSLYYLTPIDTSQKVTPFVLESLYKIDGALDAGSADRWTTNKNGAIHTYDVALWVTKLPASQSDIEKINEVIQAVKAILANVSNIGQFDQISITFIRTVDIGIARWSSFLQISKTPEQWKDLIYKAGI
jgi:uncharacterized RDD family membrane protein YckC